MPLCNCSYTCYMVDYNCCCWTAIHFGQGKGLLLLTHSVEYSYVMNCDYMHVCIEPAWYIVWFDIH